MTDNRQGAPATGLTPEELQAVEDLYRAFAGKPELLDQADTSDWHDISLAPGQAPGSEGMKLLIQGS